MPNLCNSENVGWLNTKQKYKGIQKVRSLIYKNSANAFDIFWILDGFLPLLW